MIEDAFSAFAKEKSACPSKQQGGDVGWFDRAGTMVEPFAKTAFALKPFEISDVITTQFGYHIIKLYEKTPPQRLELAKVKDDLKEQLARFEVQDKMLPDYLKKLKKDASLEYLNGAKAPAETSPESPVEKPADKAPSDKK